MELWLGLLVLVSAAVLTWGYYWLTGQPLGERGYTVVTVMSDAGGLNRGARVHMSGVEVGVVRSVELVSTDRIIVRLWLQRGVEVPRDSRVMLESVGVFGDKILVLQAGRSGTLAVDGDTLAVGTASSLMDLAGDLGDQADQVLRRVNMLLSDSTIDQVHGAVSSLPGTIRGLEKLAREGGSEFEALSRSLRETAESLRRAVDGAELDALISDLEATASKLSETADSFKESAESLASIAGKIDRGEGTLGLMVNDPGLYEDLQSAVRSIDSLTQDIMLNPGRYIKVSVF